MTKEEVIKHVNESKCQQFILYDIDPSDIEGIEDPHGLEYSDPEVQEIIRRTVNAIQLDIDVCEGFGEKLYDMVKKYLQIIASQYFKELESVRENFTKEA